MACSSSTDPSGERKINAEACVQEKMLAEVWMRLPYWPASRRVPAGLPGASIGNHPVPFPVQLADRLIRMFSFTSDTVLDPFAGTFSTVLAAILYSQLAPVGEMKHV